MAHGLGCTGVSTMPPIQRPGMDPRWKETAGDTVAVSWPASPALRRPNCRCQVLVIVKEFSTLRTSKGPRFRADVDALDQSTKDALDGGLGVDLSLPTWLGTQPASVQKQLL